MHWSWWKIPAYCMVSGLIVFEVMVRFVGRFAMVTLPDGSITSDNTRWMLMSGVFFLMVVMVGGLLFFRKLTKKELLFSASIMVLLNIIVGLGVYFVKGVGIVELFYIRVSEWNSFISQIMFRLTENPWVGAVATWFTPYIFVLFGKKSKINTVK